MSCKTIDITAKTGSNSALISVRQNELISNLRALVAVRFEQAIDYVVLVFGGQVLRDVGTIDSHGIISGVTVHVVFRQLTKEQPDEQVGNSESSNNKKNIASSGSSCATSKAAQFRSWMVKAGETLKPLLDDTNVLRDLLHSDVRMKAMMDDNATFRHYLNSDRNLRDVFSTIFNPAKVQELGRKRDLYIMRMECVPGGYSLLNRLNGYLRQVHEDNVAMKYQEVEPSECTDNPQRGLENNMPLPNPWHVESRAEAIQKIIVNTDRMVSNLTDKCNNMMKSLKLGDINKTLTHAHQLNMMTNSAQRQLENRMCKFLFGKVPAEAQPIPGTPIGTTIATAASAVGSSLNLFDFMSINDSRWEQRYQSQLLHLGTLGYTDRQRNICALLMSSGNIQTAVKLLEKWNH